MDEVHIVSHRVRRRRCRWLALCLALVLTSACSGSGTAVPDGWRAVNGGGWSFAVPSEFRDSDPRIDARRTAELVGPSQLSPGQPAELVALSTPTDQPEIDVAGYIAIVFAADPLASGIDDYEVIDDTAAEVPGAIEARTLRTSYTDTTLEGSPVVQQSVVVARDADGRIWDLRYVAAEPDFDERTGDEVTGSLALER